LSSIIKVDQIQSDSGNVNLTGNLSATTITTNTLSSTTGNVTVTSNVSVVGLQTSSNVSIAGKTLVDSTGRQYSVIDNGTTLFEEYKCRAWVNFDGTTTVPTIRASGNVSSVTRNGTGDYTVNFATAMPDANYSPSGIAGLGSAGANRNLDPRVLTTTSFRVGTANQATNALSNSSEVFVQIFR